MKRNEKTISVIETGTGTNDACIGLLYVKETREFDLVGEQPL